MPTATLIQAERPGRAQNPRGAEPPTRKPPGRVTQAEIEGRFRPITTMRLVMAFWVCKEQSRNGGWRLLRVYFAAHEMAERRRWATKGREDWRPQFSIEELRKLVGGGTTAAQLSADVRKLARLGLVTIEKHQISFARSIDQIALDDVSGFWECWQHIEKNQNRTVPVPRRTLRALAAGFTPAITATIIGLLVRCVFWQKQDGLYAIDGRTKRAWIADVFGISERSVTIARRELVKLGWLIPKADTPQWLLNRYGTHDVVNVDWKPGDNKKRESVAVGEGSAAARPDRSATRKSSSPPPRFPDESSSPINRSALSNERDNNQKAPRGSAPNPSGHSISSGRKKTRAPSGVIAAPGEPNLRDIQDADFADTGRLLELKRQAAEAGLWSRGEGSELDFLAMAERARTRGDRPGAFLMALIKDGRFGYATDAEEDRARERLRKYRNEEFERDREDAAENAMPSASGLFQSQRSASRGQARRLSPEEAFVEKCIRISKDRRVAVRDPFRVAQIAKKWTREEWDAAFFSYRQTQARQWYSDEEVYS